MPSNDKLENMRDGFKNNLNLSEEEQSLVSQQTYQSTADDVMAYANKLLSKSASNEVTFEINDYARQADEALINSRTFEVIKALIVKGLTDKGMLISVTDKRSEEYPGREINFTIHKR